MPQDTASAPPLDPVDLAAALIRCPSVTPADAGAIPLLADALAARGFECHRADRGGIANLYARRGPRGAARTFGFNGHTDVVPPGEGWRLDPFSGAVEEGWLHGRGATDMKTGVAAFAAAAAAVEPPEGCAVALAVTGDEEGESTDGTPALLDWMAENGEAFTVCLVGEPTSRETFGDTIKIGRRGAVTFTLTATGVQGHSAYPERARNPVPAMARLVDRLASRPLDEGTEHFGPSTLVPVTFDTGNPAANVIPGACRAVVNIRFNDAHSAAALRAAVEAEAASVAAEAGVSIEVAARVSGECFLTPPGPLSDLVARAVEAEAGVRPQLSTTGGTSDARFVKDHCPVVEFGLVGIGMHEVDERTEVEQVRRLARVYESVLRAYFA
jgi:succinyl-diaminopimelate desuccinylase